MSEQLKERLKNAAVAVVMDLNHIEFSHRAYEHKRQLIRSASSVAANYRAACRAKSKKDFIYKLAIVEEECDETLFWLEFLKALKVEVPNYDKHQKEFDEILAIIVTSIKSAKR